jgi:hypothetical protein
VKFDAERLRNKLDALRARVGDAKTLALNPPLDESAIVAFETTHSVALPEDCRAFISLVGNGGAGPSYVR